MLTYITDHENERIATSTGRTLCWKLNPPTDILSAFTYKANKIINSKKAAKNTEVTRNANP